MRITVTGATGLIGTTLIAALQVRGDEVTVLSRRRKNARRMLGVDDALAVRDGIVHLAGEPIAQRWTQKSKERIHSSPWLIARSGLDADEIQPRVGGSAGMASRRCRRPSSASELRARVEGDSARALRHPLPRSAGRLGEGSPRGRRVTVYSLERTQVVRPARAGVRVLR
jgi:NAD dependent epimerase/dehydratase family